MLLVFAMAALAAVIYFFIPKPTSAISSTWFVAGLLLVLVISLVDQPFFPKDGHVFVNSVAGGVSLLPVPSEQRELIWWAFIAWMLYLAVSSFTLMSLRKRPLAAEGHIVQAVSRLNRRVGRGTVVFSAIFLWATAKQFSVGSEPFTALMIYWMLFMLCNQAGMAGVAEVALARKRNGGFVQLGVISRLVDPGIVEVELAVDAGGDVRGKEICFRARDREMAKGILLDDRSMYGRRIGRIAVTSASPQWEACKRGLGNGEEVVVGLAPSPAPAPAEKQATTLPMATSPAPSASTNAAAAAPPAADGTAKADAPALETGIDASAANPKPFAKPSRSPRASTPAIIVGTVDAGTSIDVMTVNVRPDTPLEAGDLLETDSPTRTGLAHYQIVAGEVVEEKFDATSGVHRVRARAKQVGVWRAATSTFEPVRWVAPAGALVRTVGARAEAEQSVVPDGKAVIGHVPRAPFPVSVDLSDLVTHNAAIVGVTGSGKSFLALHLVEAMVNGKIRVLVLDVSRQYFACLEHLNPTKIKNAAGLHAWLASESLIGVHQFGVVGSKDEPETVPEATANFLDAVFKHCSKATLEPGRNIAAKLCVVLEEAHSLVPEWNQAVESDKKHVNRAARIILQGRKFGVGCLLVCQRTANVTKTILNQCNTLFALRSFDQTGVDFLRNYFGDDHAAALSTLADRHAVVVGKASSSALPIVVEVADLSSRWAPKADEAKPTAKSEPTEENLPTTAAAPVAADIASNATEGETHTGAD